MIKIFVFFNQYFNFTTDNYKYVIKYCLLIGIFLGLILGFKAYLYK